MKSDTNKHVAQLTFIFFTGFISCCLRWLHMPGDCQSYSEKGGIKPGIGSIQFEREKGKEALPRTFNVQSCTTLVKFLCHCLGMQDFIFFFIFYTCQTET